MEKCRYHEMLPHEVRARRKVFPVAFVGLGTLEYHGEHLAVGNDGLKAEKLCELAATKSGGFAFPTVWWGECRSKAILEVDFHEHVESRMGFDHRRATPDNFGRSIEEQWEAYRQLLFHTLVQLRYLEMKAVCLVCGHYPLWDNAAAATVERFNSRFSDCMAHAAREMDYAGNGNPEAGGDHAGKWETSMLWYLRPDCIDTSVFKTNPDYCGISEGKDGIEASSRAVGARAAELIVAGMVKKAGEMLLLVDGAEGRNP